MQGMGGPLMTPGFGAHRAILSDLAKERHVAILQLLKTQPLASFYTGIQNADSEWRGSGQAKSPYICYLSDCCTDSESTPDQPNPNAHICGFGNGLFWQFELMGEWLQRHITLTKALGPAINPLLLAPLHEFR